MDNANYFTGLIVDNTKGATTDPWMNKIIRTGIAAGELPEEIADLFTFEIVNVDGEDRAIVRWA